MPKIMPEYREEARKKIIASAVAVMQEKGFYLTTLDDIAKNMGVTKGALYLYFENKEALLKAIIESYHEGIRDSARDIFSRYPSAEGFRIFIDEFVHQDPKKTGLYFEMLSYASRNTEIQHFLRATLLKGADLATRGFTRMQEKGEISPGVDPYRMALAFIALTMGMRALVVMGVEEMDDREFWDESVQRFFRENM
jgi:AcrR family transcriptional regulator